MASEGVKHVLLTGPPGVGKTTVVRKVCERLVSNGINVRGFYTEDVGRNNRRIGFDVVDAEDGNRMQLARAKEYLDTHASHMPQVGRYLVDVPSFETIALTSLSKHVCGAKVLVLDEVGKMELLSTHFHHAVAEAFQQQNGVVLATVPVSKDRHLRLVEDLKRRKDAILLTVNRGNRDSLPEEVADILVRSVKSLPT